MYYHLLLIACLTTIATGLHSATYNYEIKIDHIINNPNKTEFYYNCFMETAQCDRESALLRFFIADALNGCYRCPELVQPVLKKFMKHLVETDDEKFLAMAAKYDETDGIFAKLYRKQMRRTKWKW